MALFKKWNANTSLRGGFVTAAIFGLLLLAACGGDSSSGTHRSGVMEINGKSINGVSQKGPFVTGAVVKLYELDGKTYAQTGKSFTGKIITDDGKFGIPSVTLASQYALLEANGYFRNEITGNKSKGPITLYALTDLSDREKVNINLLTHLEYERALYLMGTGVDLPSAKKQAEAEILNAFGIKGEFANSEDLDIFSGGEGDAALLALSVLMLGGLEDKKGETEGSDNVAELTDRLTKFAIDIEKDGVWDDEEYKAKIADWVSWRDSWGGLNSIRSKVETWNLGVVPNFEKYVRSFLNVAYGLGECSTSEDIGKMIEGVNKYYCTANGWVSLTSGGWNWDVPKEARMNSAIAYNTMIDSRDGQFYKTVKIGDQVWMAENLNYADSMKTPSLLMRSWCFNDVPEYCAVTGRLYTWAAAIDSVKLATDVDYPQDCGYGKTCSLPAKVQGICPDGWHLPTESEWNSLFSEVGGVSAALGNLTSQTGCDWGFGMDTYGFSALPAGFRAVDGRFGSGGSDAAFWSATEIDLSHANAYVVYLYSFDRDAYSGSHKGEAFSIRCLQD